MSELTLMVLRIAFLLLLWLFIFSIVYALRSDLFGAPVRKIPGDAAKEPPQEPLRQNQATPMLAPTVTPTVKPPPAVRDQNAQARMLVITSGAAIGTTLPLDDEVITIGRSPNSTLVIVDEYTSTHHAKIHKIGQQWCLTDLDSTNGTKLDGRRVTDAVLIPVGAPITIGTTTFELRP